MSRLTFDARSHSYTLDGETVPGVTSVIGLLDKPALVTWAARETAAYADEHWERLSQLRSADRIAELERARYQSNRKAIVKGHRVHAMAEDLQHGRDVQVPPELATYVQPVARLLDMWQMESVATEQPLAHTEHLYAGTFDSIVKSPKLGTVLMDWKTGKGVYDEVGLQLAAYRYANLRLIEKPQTGPRGGKLPSLWEEAPMIPVDACYVVHVQDGTATLHPVEAGPEVYEVFLALVDIYHDWHTRTAWAFRGKPSYAPLIGEPIWPEGVHGGNPPF